MTQRTGSWPALVAIGAAAGGFSALFGVGGGVVIVPLLVLWCGYSARAATATSLAAIAPIALWGAAVHGLLGNVQPVQAALVGIPALVGVSLGVRLKRRLASERLTYAFCVLLVVMAVLVATEPV